MKRLLLDVKKHAIILVIICTAASIFLIILGNFIELHPDAYFDLNRSIIVVYIVMYIFQALFSLAINKTTFGSKLKTHLNTTKRDEPIKSIAITFTVITLINSLMMIIGIDTPKAGVFAYIHMMTRFLIVFSIISLLMWKDFALWTKRLSLKNPMNQFLEYARNHVFSAISILFTLVTVVYCSTVIILSRLLNPVGGINFYITLLVVLLIITLILNVLKNARTSR